jgi:hypothetical protein
MGASIGNNREVMSEARPSNTQSLDPLLILSSTLQTAFEAVAGRAGIDPVIRPSEHADAQANGALALAKLPKPSLPNVLASPTSAHRSKLLARAF